MFDLYELFESVDIIVDKRVKAAQSQMDRTLISSIVKTDKKQYGEYTVDVDGAEITAYCSDTTYEVGDVVYVGIPANDFTNAYIIAKKLNEANIMQNAANPFNNYFKMIVNKQEQMFNYDLTRAPVGKVPIVELKIDKSENYNALGIEGEFWTHFETAPKLSNYGLLISVQTDQNTNQEGAPLLRSHPYTFGSEKMIGQVFNYIGGSTQRVLIDLQGISNIVAVKVYGYFYNNEAEGYVLNDADYIKIKNLEVSLGHVLSSSDTSDLIIYTPNALKYNVTNKDDTVASDLNKTLYARWIYKDKDNLKAVTHYNVVDFPKIASLKWQREENGQWLDIVNSDNQFVYSLTQLDRFKLQEKIRAIVTYFSFDAEAPEEYISNEIVFQNAKQDYANIIVDKTVTVKTDIDDFSAYYGPDGSILDYGLGKLGRKISFEAYAQDIDLDETISIKVNWKFNISNSMLIPWGFNSTQKEEPTSQKNDYCIYSQVIWDKDKERPEDGILKGSIYFALANYYTPAKKNNDVICEIVVVRNKDGQEQLLQTDSTTQSLKFRRNGVCQSDKILQLTMRNNRGEEVRSIIPGESVMIEAVVYDCNGNIITPVGEGIKWSWWYAPESKFIDINVVGTNRCSLISTEQASYNDIDLCYILEAKYEEKNNKSTKTASIKGYFPIALNLQSQVISYSAGPTSIYYNSAGGSPSYYNEAYRLFLSSGIEFKSNVVWKGYEKGGIAQSTSYSLYPTVGQADNNYYLIPKLTYTKEADKGYCVYGQIGDLIFWVQPIVIIQTNSFSSFINEWDGSFSLDEENNQLMAARLGAGRKNDDNTFSGVLLGDWRAEDGSTPVTGVYGFDHNIQSYGLREDGTAFFGKAGNGRINFNGNLGLIYSGNFDGSFYKTKVLIDSQKIFSDNNISFDMVTGDSAPISESTLTKQNQQVEWTGEISTRSLASSSSVDFSTYPVLTFSNLSNGTNYAIFEINLSVEELNFLLGSSEKDSTSEIALNIDNATYFQYKEKASNQWKYFPATGYVNYITLSPYDEANESTSSEQENISNKKALRIYYGASFRIKIKLAFPTTAIGLKVPLINLIGIGGETGKLSGREFRLQFSNPSLQLLDDDSSYSITEIEADKELTFLSPAYIGTQGTFINLKDGEIIANKGTFRGDFEVESMKLMKDLVIGDPTGQSGNWIRITPDGRFLTSQKAKDNDISTCDVLKMSLHANAYSGSVPYTDFDYVSYYGPGITGSYGNTWYQISDFHMPLYVFLNESSLPQYYDPENDKLGSSLSSSGDTYYAKLMLGDTEVGASSNDFSDQRLKSNIQIINNDWEIKYDQLQPKEYEFNITKKHSFGFIANEIQTLFPDTDLVGERIYKGETYLTLNYNELVALNTDQIQKSKKRIKVLEQEVQTLKKEILLLKGDKNTNE